MGKSVKLTDGSYIDAEGVWDNALGMTLADINTCGEKHTITASTVFTGVKSGEVQWWRMGKLVFVYFHDVQITQQSSQNTVFYAPLASLGMPNSAVALHALCSGSSHEYSGYIRAGNTNITGCVYPGSTVLYGSLCYIAAD